MVINLSHQETERRRHHEGSLAEVWQELLHQVRNDPCRLVYERAVFNVASGKSDSGMSVSKMVLWHRLVVKKRPAA